MPYSRFLREAEPHKASECSHCGTLLRRRDAAWAVLGLGGMAFALPLFAAIAAGVTAAWIVLGAAIALPFWTLAVNFVGWKFVGWKIATERATTTTRR